MGRIPRRAGGQWVLICGENYKKLGDHTYIKFTAYFTKCTLKIQGSRENKYRTSTYLRFI